MNINNRLLYSGCPGIYDFISGEQVQTLEAKLLEYVGAKQCIICGNGIGAISTALMEYEVEHGDGTTLILRILTDKHRNALKGS